MTDESWPEEVIAVLNRTNASSEAPSPLPDTDDSAEDFFSTLGLFDEPKIVRSGDPEEQVQRILDEVPEADPVYVRDLVSRASDEFIDLLLDPNLPKRNRAALRALFKFGGVTEADLPNRINNVAIRTLRDFGIPLVTEWVWADGRRILKYTLDPGEFISASEARVAIPPKMRREVLLQSRGVCSMCSSRIGLDYDHRVPFRRVGNGLLQKEGSSAIQLLCQPHNNEKKTVCMKCVEPLENCSTCYWAYPGRYTHSAGRKERRLVLVASTPEEMLALAEVQKFAAERGL